jgi:hypothetical protein
MKQITKTAAKRREPKICLKTIDLFKKFTIWDGQVLKATGESKIEMQLRRKRHSKYFIDFTFEV